MSKSSPWGNIGAWAAEAERAEAEEREQAAAAAAAAAAAPSVAGAGGDSQNFPSLREAASTKQKKKAAKMTLQEFTMQGTFGSGGSSSRLTPDEMLRLPTGPKERSPEEMQSGRLGGGFSNYGSRFMGPQPGRSRDRDAGDGEGSWGNNRRSYGGFDDDRRGGGPPSRASSDFDQPSRADEVDNWASTKKPLSSFDSNSNSTRSRYAMLGAGGGASRADGDDNWAASKKPIAPPPARSSTFGSGFRDSRPEPERWTRGSTQRLVLESQSPKSEQGATENVIEITAKVNKPNPFGAARPREEVLAEKGLDWKKLDIEIEAKKGSSRPTSSQSSRPESSQSARSDGQALQGGMNMVEGAVKPKAKVNPFGDAKPREVLLQEKGLDWRKIDLDLERRINRPETDEEKNLKKEIEQLKKETLQNVGEDQATIHDLINQKERELELLIRDLDDKVRFGEKATERPGSGSKRVTSFAERPPSQSGSVDEHRSGEFMDRPRSRGTGDAWTGPVDDRRAFHGGRSGEDRRANQGASPTEDRRAFQGARSNDDRRFFQGGRERRYFGNRNMERSRSDDRW